LVSGFERARLEIRACEDILTAWTPEMYASGSTLIDVGANVLRLQQALEIAAGLGSAKEPRQIPTVWSLLPILQFGDERRLQCATNHRALFPHCACRLEECSHVRDMAENKRIGGFILIHSMYYFSPKTLLEMTKVAPVWAVCHRYFDAAGTHGSGDMVWSIQTDGLVHAKAAGNLQEYVHPDNGWLQNSHFTLDDSTMTWDVVSTQGDTVLVRFDRSPFIPPIAPRSLGWSDTNEDGVLSDYLTSIMQQGLKTVVQDRSLGPLHSLGFEEASVSKLRVHLCYGRPTFSLGEKIKITVPRDAIGFAASKASMQSRTPLLMSSIHAALVSHLLKGGFPPDLVSSVALVATIAGMSRDVEKETGTVGMYNRNFRELNSTHSRVIAGEPLHKWTWRDWFWPSNWLGLACDCVGQEEPFRVDEAVQYQQLRNNGVAPTFPGPVLVLGDANRFRPAAELRPPPPMAESARLTLLPSDDIRLPVQPVLTQHLPAFAGFVPTTTPNTEEAFIAGARARVLAAQPEPELGVWPALCAQCRESPATAHFFLDDPVVLTDELVQHWVERYPIKQRPTYLNAWEAHKHKRLSSHDLLGAPFLKIEKSANVTVDGVPDIDPRLVVAMKPVVAVALGPVFSRVGELVRAAQRHLYSPIVQPLDMIVWVNGMDYDFGAMIDYCLATMHDPVFEHGDQSRFETKRRGEIGEEVEEVQLEYCEHHLYREVLCGTAGVHGRAQRFPVKIDVDDTMASGLGKTSLDSVFRNSASMLHVFGPPVPTQSAIFVNGDDWMRVSARSYALGLVGFVEKLEPLGFVSDYTFSEHSWEVEFCQLLLWPDSTGKIVPASKPFRVLSRLPFSTSSDKFDPAGVARSLLKANAHVPFLGPYLRFVCKRSTSRAAPIPEWHLHSGASHRCGEPTYAFLFARYGLTPEDERDFMLLLDMATDLRSVLNYPHFARCLAIDS